MNHREQSAVSGTHQPDHFKDWPEAELAEVPHSAQSAAVSASRFLRRAGAATSLSGLLECPEPGWREPENFCTAQRDDYGRLGTPRVSEQCNSPMQAGDARWGTYPGLSAAVAAWPAAAGVIDDLLCDDAHLLQADLRRLMQVALEL